MMKSYAVVTLACLAVAAESFILTSGPSHASCNVDWTFSMKCSDIEAAIVKQIGIWKDTSGCPTSGEKCLYKLLSSSATQIKATRTTREKHYVDDLTFTLTQEASMCKVHGFSTSETWYAVLDFGTNYCNLFNLLDGAGLVKTAGYSETTSDKICTQYSKRDCAVH
ncbi:uncharacterized protein [Haliotis cracherodii]|uniref:uncharacterized protein LOC124130878 n=1 Tax=Haliotis rufescens TaxID=6454 RepID=UPI001EAF9B8F|nr:uncharacterized protein LOC124130878 [Haliotis rufescens]